MAQTFLRIGSLIQENAIALLEEGMTEATARGMRRAFIVQETFAPVEL